MIPLDPGQFAAHEAGELPGIVALGDGIWALSLPLPVGAPAYTLVYAITDAAAGVHLIDTGWELPGSLELLTRGLESVGLSLERVESITATHLHSDHLGLAKAIRAVSGARVQVHAVEQHGLDEFAARGVTVPDLGAWGVPEELRAGMAALVARTRPEALTADVLLADGDLLDIPGREVRVLHTPGHTAGSICLLTGDTLFTGDLLLPAIFPGIGLGGDSPDPLADYFASLDRLAALGDPVVAPGHGYVFRGLAERVRVSRAHQAGRTREVETIVGEHPDALVWEVASRVTWTGGWANLTGFHQASALSQTAMRMEHLRRA